MCWKNVKRKIQKANYVALSSNTLYYGDNLHILKKHITEPTFDLIYLDPPSVMMFFFGHYVINYFQVFNGFL